MKKYKMLKRIFFIILIFSIFQKADAQQFIVDKFLQAGGENIDLVKDLHIDSKGNVYIAGEFKEDTNFSGKKVKSKAKKNIFIARYSSKTKIKDVNIIDGSGFISLSSITSDKENNIYICGDFCNEADFSGKKLQATNYKDNFIAKYSAKGKMLWVKHIEADTKNENTFIVYNNERLFYAGTYYNTIYLDNFILSSESDADIFVSEIDTEGNFIDAISIGGFNTDILNDIACTKEGNVYLTGAFSNKLNFAGQEIISKGKTDVFIAKLIGTKPDVIKQFGSYYTDYGKKIKFYKDKVLLLGSFSGELNFEDTKLQSNGVLDTYIASFDKDCNLHWAKSIGGQANEYAHSFAISSKGNIYFTGNFRGKIIGKNTIEANSFRSDIFIAKFNIKGEQIWLKKYGGEDYDYPVDMLIDKDDYIYQTGNFGKNFKMDELKAQNIRGDDIYIARFYDCENSIPLQLGKDTTICANNFELKTAQNFETYVWNNGIKDKEVNVDKSGEYILTVTDEFACEFKDTINITLLPLPKLNLPAEITFNENETITLDAGASFETYLWSTGSKEQKIQVSEEDIYSIKVTNKNNCENYAEVFVKEKANAISENTNSKLATDDLKLDVNILSLDVYPNPAKDEFFIKIKNINTNKKLHIEIIDENGKLIYKETKTSKSNFLTHKIKLNNMSAGVFSVVVVNGEGKVGENLVVYK